LKEERGHSSVCADVAFAMNKYKRGLWGLIVRGEGVQQGENTGIS